MAAVHGWTLHGARQPSGLVVCGVLSFALHLLLFPSFSQRPAAQDEQSGPVRRVVHARVVPPTLSAAILSVSQTQVKKKPARVSEVQQALAPLLTEATSADADAALDDSPQPDQFVDKAFLPRSSLTAVPYPQRPVLVPYPVFDSDEGHYLTELSLFIDEEGWVQRVDIARQDLPSPLTSAIRQTFMAARFEPGEVDGRPVRSQIRIEVSFESSPLTP